MREEVAFDQGGGEVDVDRLREKLAAAKQEIDELRQVWSKNPVWDVSSKCVRPLTAVLVLRPGSCAAVHGCREGRSGGGRAASEGVALSTRAAAPLPP